MQHSINKTLQVRVYCLLLWLLIAPQLVAQEYLVQTTHYGIEDGLSHRDVQCVYQDRQNLIWLGTKYGLNRFDGLNFKWYTKETAGLQSNIITKIAEDVKGRMWLISTEHRSYGEIGSIDIFDPVTEKVESFEKSFGGEAPFEPNDLLGICQNTAGRLVMLTKYKELIIYDGKFKTIPICEETPIIGQVIRCSPTGLIWLIINVAYTGKGQPGGTTTLLAYDQNGTQVRRFEHKDYDFSTILDFDEQGNCHYLIAQSGKENQFYHITPDGRQLKDSATKQLFANNGLNTRSWNYLFNVRKHRNVWWMSAGENEQGIAFIGFPADSTGRLVSGNSFDNITYVNDIFHDRSGRLWLGTQFGLHLILLKPNNFSKLLYNESNERIATRNIVQDDAGNIWVVQDNKFNLWKIDHDTGKAALVNQSDNHQDKLPIGNYFVALFKDRKGFLYYQSENYLIKFNPATLDYEKVELTGRNDKWMFYRVWAFYEDDFGKIWFSLDNGEIGYWDGSKTVWFPPLEKLNGSVSFAYQFFKDQNGQTWLTTDGGLYILDIQTGKILSRYWSGGKNEYYFPFDNLLNVYEDPDGSFWIGTNGSGLVHWNKGKPLNRQNNAELLLNAYRPSSGLYEQFTSIHGLSNNVIYAVYPDKFDNLWLPSDYGLMRFNKNSTRTQTYLTADGISHNEFNRVSHDQAADGTLYFGGLNGITVFHPNTFSDTQSEENLPLVITDYQQFTEGGNVSKDKIEALLQNKAITLLPRDRFFKLEFMLLNYADAGKNRYAYKIDDIDRDWHYQKENVVNFSSLPYGKHQLQIKGQTPGGQWSANTLTLQVEVVKPIYLRVWFLLLSVCVLVAGSYLYYHRRTVLLRQRKDELEHIVEERTHQILMDKITIEQQAEELKMLERQKSRFFANVSHELRTPLSLIIGPIASLLKRDNYAQQDRQLLKYVYRNGRQLLKLVNEILDLSKLEMGYLEVKETGINFQQFVQSLLSQFDSSGNNKAIDVGLVFHADPQLNIMADIGMLEKVVFNFLSNAMKFTPKGGHVQLTVEDMGGDLMVKVTDTGTGIHPDDLPFIFDRFYQSKLHNAPTQGGSGIGLSLCKELAQLMGGTVWVESEWGRGSTFYFQFPKKIAPPDIVAAILPIDNIDLVSIETGNNGSSLPHNSNKTASASKPVLLVVEDNHDLRNYLNILMAGKYEVINAENGKEAWELLLSGTPPNLILSDIMMPVMDGFQLLEKVKSHDNFRHIPVIMLTAREGLGVKLKALRIGVDDYLTKPFEEEELIARIDNLLANYFARMETFHSNITNVDETPDSEQPVMGSADALWLEEVEKVFTQYLTEPQFDMDWAADKLNMSQRQLHRRIKQLTGLAPHQYLREMRLQIAKDLLYQGKYATIKEVGYAVGYSDIKYFSSQFFERFGSHPSAYQHNSIAN